MSEPGGWQSIEDMRMFSETEELCDTVWRVVGSWTHMAQDTAGKQLIRAVDSIGANLVEGEGRYHFREKLNFCYVARGSAREAAFWLRRAQARQLLPNDQAVAIQHSLHAVTRWINTLITQRRHWVSQVREDRADYGTELNDTEPDHME